MAQYGISYKGSKNKIADKIISLFPRKNNFYDLFCGGCAITHAALLSNKFNHYVMNDINDEVVNLFIDAVHGKYKNESRWISREDFFKLKDHDPYVKYLWSFGNKGTTYLYGQDIEPYKKALHYAIIFNDLQPIQAFYPLGDFSFLEGVKGVNNRRLELQRYFKKTGVASGSPLESSAECDSLLQSLTRLQSLERLEALERLQGLEALERLQASCADYRDVKILPNSLIYCDIPYKNTDGYNEFEFDFNAFYKWCAEQKELLFISSYEMPENDFLTVAEIPHRCTLSHESHYAVIEKVFIPRHQQQLYLQEMPQPLLFDDYNF